MVAGFHTLSFHVAFASFYQTLMLSSFVFQEDDVETAMGLVHVHVQGNRQKPAILTYHDIGLNGEP
jgi:hypothetical protein